MEAQQESKPRGSKDVSLSSATPVRRRSTRHLVEPPQKQSPMVFDPCDPYSSAMDNIPLKDLFPNMKVRKRSQGRKVEASDMPSPRNMESEESVRSKLRDSLAAALKTVDSAEWDQDRGQDIKTENQMGDQSDAVPSSMETEDKIAKEAAELGLEHVVSEGNVGPDRKENLDKLDSSFLKEGNVDSTEMKEAAFKRMKVEAERIEREDASNRNQASDLVERVAIDIESELYRHFGGVNRKYKEKARSLLFNLKDRSNPELRSRVLVGEITPENLCSMNAEQLASKELSQWRMAKAEEFAHMVVFTDADAEQPRLVKKTHKGEIEVKVEKDDGLTEVDTSGSQQRFALATKQEPEETGASVVAGPLNINQDLDYVVAGRDAEGMEFSPIRDLNFTVGISVAADQLHDKWMQDAGEELGEAEMESASQGEGDANLPAIMSLDEFLGSKKGKEPKLAVEADELELKLGRNEIKPDSIISQINTTNSPSLTSFKDRVPQKPVESLNRKPSVSGSTKNGSMSQKERKKVHRVNEKLWEGSFQLSGCQISPVLALYKSGDGVELQSWPKLIEIKGRVRLDALEKFLQELRLSRTRAVMIIACVVDEGQTDHGGSVNALKEAASQYQKGERVGYAEPVPGYEVYLFPGGGTSLKLLVEHGYLNMDQILAEEEGILVGCVVCRRSLIPTNASHKSSSHYFNANRHALSAQLDSPTRPNEIQWIGNVVATSKTPSLPLPSSKEFENHSASVPSVNLQRGVSVPNNNVEGGMHAAANKTMPNSSQQTAHNPSEPDSIFSRSIQPPQDPRSGKVKPDWLQKDLMKDEDIGDDLPPGFGPKAMAMAKHGNEEDDDDDLPEYDFSAQNLLRNFNNIKPPEVHLGAPPPQPQPFGMQVSFPPGSIFPPLPQAPQGSVCALSSQPETSIPFNQFNPSGQHPSQFPKPIISHVRGPLEQVRPPLLLSPQVSQPIHSHAVGPRPPPGLPPGPPPFNVFSPRPHLSADGSLAARVPSSAQTPVPNVLHAEQKDAFGANLNQPSQNQPILPRLYGDPARPDNVSGVHDQRTRAAIPVVQSHPMPASHTITGPRHKRGTRQASSLWDDDDMPEWCPPTLPQPESRQIPPRLPVLPMVEPGPGVPVRGMIPPPIGRGWRGMPPPPMVPLQGEGRGILQAPPPAMRYPGPSSRGVFPIARPEQFPADRNRSIRPNEPRVFKSGK